MKWWPFWSRLGFCRFPITGKPGKNSTINRELACLKSILKRAERQSKISNNPTRFIGLLEEDNVRDRILTESEYKALVLAAPQHLKPIIITASETGMRRGEILGLTWDRVNLQEGLIRLDGLHTKTKRGRKVPVSPALKLVLEPMQKKQGPVFSYRGQPMRDLKSGFKAACKKAGIEDFRFHDLRHCFVTNTRRRGVPDRVIMAITGHTTLECFSRYDAISQEDLVKAVAVPKEKSASEKITQKLHMGHSEEKG